MTIDQLPITIAAAQSRRAWEQWRIEASKKALAQPDLPAYARRAAEATIVYCKARIEQLDAWLETQQEATA